MVDGGLRADDGWYVFNGIDCRDKERFKVQSFNDFLVFSIQGIASLSSGWFLYNWGWQGVIWASLPLVLVFALLVWFL